SVAQLSQYFQKDSQTAYAFSNAMMTQHARMGEHVQRAPAAPLVRDLGPEIPGSAKSEDLFVYTIKNLSLKKGQRAVIPVAAYTDPGADTDVTVTTAVDIKVKKTDKEVKRTPDAVNWQKTSFTRIDGTGTITLANFRDQPVEIEVVRLVLGEIDGADHDGSVE